MRAGPKAASPRAECSGAEARPGAQATTAMASESLGAAPTPPEWITFPLPLTGLGRCPLARPAGVLGPPQDPQAFQYSVCSPAPCPNTIWAEGLACVARKVLPALILLLFLPSKSNFWKSSSLSVSSCLKFRSRKER